MVRKFSKRARGYILIYMTLESDEMKHDQTGITHQMIEKMKKFISSHRAALDFDKGHLNKVITSEGYDFRTEVKSEKVGLVRVRDNRGGARKRGQTLLEITKKGKKQKSSDNK